MKKNVAKRIVSGLLAMAMVCGLVTFVGGDASVVKAAESKGTWTMTKHYDEQTPSTSSGWKYDLSYKYDETAGKVIHSKLCTLSNVDGTFTATETSTCTIPKSTIAGEETVKVDIVSEISGNTLDNQIEFCHSFLCKKDTTLYFRDVNDSSHYWISANTGPNSKLTDSATLQYTFPNGDKDGDTYVLLFEQNSGNSNSGLIKTYWEYTWKSNATSTPTATTPTNTPTTTTTDTGTIGDDDDDVSVGQVKNVKLTNKKVKRIYIKYSAVSGAAGYQIRYSTKKSMSGAKNLVATGTKGYFKNSSGKKTTFKKGKTYYVQVRAYATDSSGDRIYGKWSAKKKVKIKR